MLDVKELELAVEKLAPAELIAFRTWFLDYDAELWDEEIEADYHSGKLDKFISEAIEDFQQGKASEI